MSERAELFQLIRKAVIPAGNGVSSGVLKSVLRCIHDHGDVCTASIATMALESGWCRRVIHAALSRLEEAGLIHRTKRLGKTDRISINWHSIKSLDQCTTCTPTAAPSAPLPMHHVHTGYAPRAPLPVHEMQEGCAPHAQTHALGAPKTKETKKKPKRESDAFASDACSDEDLTMANEMFESLLAIHKKHKRPNLTKWATAIRLMRERDGRTAREIRVMWRLVREHSFWRENILSPEKLRAQWDQLVLKGFDPTPANDPENPFNSDRWMTCEWAHWAVHRSGECLIPNLEFDDQWQVRPAAGYQLEEAPSINGKTYYRVVEIR